MPHPPARDVAKRTFFPSSLCAFKLKILDQVSLSQVATDATHKKKLLLQQPMKRNRKMVSV
jgi:hypothetical protein